jgi:hypothetical protein
MNAPTALTDFMKIVDRNMAHRHDRRPMLDLTKPLWAADRSTVEVLKIEGNIITARLTTTVGQKITRKYDLRGRVQPPMPVGDRSYVDLTNEPPATGRCSVLSGSRFPRFMEDI